MRYRLDITTLAEVGIEQATLNCDIAFGWQGGPQPSAPRWSIVDYIELLREA